MKEAEIFLNWKKHNMNLLPDNIRNEYNQNIIPRFEKLDSVFRLKSFFQKLEIELRNSERPLCFKTKHYNYSIGNKLDVTKYNEAFNIQIERYKQGFQKGIKLKSSLKGKKLFRQLKNDLIQLDYSDFFKSNGDVTVIVLVEENIPQEFYSFPIDLYEYGKRTGYFVNCWEALLAEYCPKIINEEPLQSKAITKEQILNEDNKLIPNVDINEVYNYFEILTKSKNKYDKNYLTQKQLLTFIKATFIDLEPIPNEFNGEPNSKKDVRSLFFRFYEQCSRPDYKAKHKKQKYFNIMFETFGYFFDETKDFNEWNKTKQRDNKQT